MIEAAENLPHALDRVWRVWIDHRIDLFCDSRRKRGALGAAGDDTRSSQLPDRPGRWEAAGVGHVAELSDGAEHQETVLLS